MAKEKTGKSNFSDTLDVALVNAAVANVARQVCQCDTVAALFDVRRPYFFAEVKRNTFVALPGQRARRPACLASWGDELRKGLVGCGLSVANVSRCCFRNHSCSIAGAVHGYDIFIAGPRERVLKIGALLKERWEARDQVIGPRP